RGDRQRDLSRDRQADPGFADHAGQAGLNRRFVISAVEKQKARPVLTERASACIISLTITYFHTGCSTIIGAKSFHGPVRDGKGWYRLAMVIRHDLYGHRGVIADAALNLEEVVLLKSVCSTLLNLLA